MGVAAMNFNEYVKNLRARSLDRPKKTVKASSRFQIPHEPGTMSKGVLSSTAESSNDRARVSPASGEVVGLDPATGEALVRQAGNRVVRVQAEGATAGNTVSIDNPSSPKTVNLFGVKKAGSVTNPASVASKGWQPVPGRPSASKLSATSSRQVEGLDRLADPCVSPEEKLQLVFAERARGVGITDKGVVGFTSSVGGVQLSNQASRDTEAYIQQLYQEIKDRDRQQQTLPQNLSLDSTGGTQAISQQFSATQASLWKCENNVCVQAVDGIFATKEQCEANCGVKSFSCVNGTCVQVPGSTGKFKSLGECINAGCNTRYTCIDGTPVPKKDGEFATLEAAISGGCFWGYNCNSSTGDCEPAIGGTFKSLQCCTTSCVPITDAWPRPVSRVDFSTPPTYTGRYQLLTIEARQVTLTDPGCDNAGNGTFWGDRFPTTYCDGTIDIPAFTDFVEIVPATIGITQGFTSGNYDIWARSENVNFVTPPGFPGGSAYLGQIQFSYFNTCGESNNYIQWVSQVIDSEDPTKGFYAPTIPNYFNTYGPFVGSEVDHADVSNISRGAVSDSDWDKIPLIRHADPNEGPLNCGS